MIAPEDYCREIEAHLCRKNDGHLIRIVGPAFEQVAGWAREGIPLKVACAGVDRYFARYYRKGPRRRPVRIEYCDADVRDAFDDWRRAVGVRHGGGVQDEPDASRPRRSSLAAHLERAINRLTTLRGSTQSTFPFAEMLDDVVRRLDVLVPEARRARGDARAALGAQLHEMDRELIEAVVATLSPEERERLVREAERELEPFRSRMLPETLARAQSSAFDRLVRERFRLPSLGYE